MEIRLGEEPVLFDPLPFIISPPEFSLTRPTAHLGVYAPLLNNVCQQLYNDLAKFRLEDERNPNLIATIDESLRSESGWCYQALQNKHNQLPGFRFDLLSIRIRVDHIADPPFDYPCIIELWPAGHHGSICVHSTGTFGLIRVLHGKLSIKFFPSLALSSQPDLGFEQLFEVDQMIWVMPDLNQTYQIIYPDHRPSFCITIQAFSHGPNLNENENMIADIDYVAFKERMRRESQCQ